MKDCIEISSKTQTNSRDMACFKTCLSIAGFDGSGGAGIQADLKTVSALGCYGMTVLTALPVQNTCGVKKCYEIPLQSITDQLQTIFEDIVPDAIKIGMLFSEPIITVVANFLRDNAANIPIVLDPVMVAKSGDPLLLPEAVESLREKLIPMAAVITPNLPEALALIDMDALDPRLRGDDKIEPRCLSVENIKELPHVLSSPRRRGSSAELMQTIAAELLKLGPKAVLLKGGHAQGDQSNDLFVDQFGQKVWLEAPRIDTKNVHGTGCTLSAAIASNIALGLAPLDACRAAKDYLFKAIKAGKESSVGKGHGPVHHFHNIWPPMNRFN